MSRRWSVPFPLILIAIAIGFGSCVVVQHFAKQEVFRDAAGRPLDWAGDKLICPHCDRNLLRYRGGYRYTCEGCGESVEVRYDSHTGENSFSPVAVE